MKIFPNIMRANQSATLHGVGGLLDVFGAGLTQSVYSGPTGFVRRGRKKRGEAHKPQTPAP